MKPQLIDNVSTDTKAEFKVEVWNNKFYNTWKYAKPLNYNYDFFTKLKHAYYVLTGKAYAFRFFEDFSDEEKSQYIKSDIKSRVAEHKMKWNEKIVSEIEIEEESIKKDVVVKQEKKAELRRRKAKIIEENKNKPKSQINNAAGKAEEKPIYANPETTYLQYEFTDEMIAEIEKYLSAGVRREKIHVTNMPSVCMWSHTRAKVVDGSSEGRETIKQEDGTLKTIKNNVMVSLKPNRSLDVSKINASNGIIITKYSGQYFRFNYIPKP